jgi:hypothetical protein
MGGDLVMLMVGAVVLGLAYWAWNSAVGAREEANRVARDACSRAVVQFLDGTVVFAGLRLARDGRGRRRLLRTYTFDYTHDGVDRSQGFVVMEGVRVEAVGLQGAPS